MISKKAWIYTSSVALALSIVGCAIVWLNLNKRYENNDPLERLPVSAALLFRANGIDTILNVKEKYWTDILHEPHVHAVYKTLSLADSLLQLEASNVSSLSCRPFYLAAYPDSGKLAAVAAFQLHSYMEGYRLLQTLDKSKHVSIVKKRVDNVDISCLSITKTDSLFLFVDRGILLISPSQRCLLSVLNANPDNTLAADATFSTVNKTVSDGARFSLFVHLSQIKSLTIDNGVLSTLAAEYEGSGDWIELDADIQQNTIILNGFVSSAKPTMATVWASAKPKVFSLNDYIPSDVSRLICYSADKRGLSNTIFSKYLSANGLMEQYRDRQEHLYATYGVDVEAQLSTIFSGDIAWFSRDDANNGDCLVVGCANGTLAQADLNAVIGTLNNTETASVVTNLSPSDNVTLSVFSGFENPENLFFLNALFDSVPCKYYLRYENAIFFSNEIKVLKDVLYDNMLNRTLKNNADFCNFKNSFPLEQQYFSFSSSSRLKTLSASATLANLKSVANFYGFGIQVSGVEGMPYVTIGAQYAPNRTITPPTAWQSRLDTVMVGNPNIVKNHNTNEHEIVVQDAANNIYLINSKGLVIWKRKIDGQIIGGVKQIDYYNNGKMQYLLNTETSIYIIDRNSNNTGPFPVLLPAKATNAVTYIDYGKPLEFRLFVACDDKQICLYDRDAKRIQGWNMQKTDGTVSRQLQHFVSNNKDYLVVVDDYRCYISDRRGDERIKPNMAFAPNVQSQIALVRQNTAKAAFITTDADGSFVSISVLDGTVTKTPINDVAGQPHSAIYISSRNQYLVFTPKKMVTLDDCGKVLSTTDLYLASVSLVQLCHDGNIAIWDSEEHLGYLVDLNGEVLDGFPIPAASQFFVMQIQETSNIIVAGLDGSLFDFLK